MLRLSIEYVATIFDSKKVINKNSVIANITSTICIPRRTPRKCLYQEGQYESLSPRTQLKTLPVWMKVFPPVGILLERMMAMSFLQVRRKRMSVDEAKVCIRIASELHVQSFFNGFPVPLPEWFCHGLDCRLSRKSTLKTFLLIYSHERNGIPLYLKNYTNIGWKKYSAKAVVQRCSVKKMFFEISQNSRENTCARVLFK